MKRILAGVLAALLSISVFAATQYPLALMSPTGSTFGQVPVSTGPSTAPTWGSASTSLASIAALQAATSATLPVAPVNVLGFASATDGGGGTFAVGTTTTANGCTIFNDASGRSWYRQGPNTPVNVRWCGAKGNGVTNDSTAFANVVGTTKSIFVPDGNYPVNENVIILTSGQSFQGQSRGSYVPAQTPNAGTIISCVTNAGHPCISIIASASWVTVRDLTVIRTASPGTIATGGDGIHFLGNCIHCYVDDVEIYNHSVGLFLQDAFGWVKDVITENNTLHGVLMQNSAANGGMEWFLDNVLSQANGGWGYLFQTQIVAGATVQSLENMSNIFSFGNTSGGMLVSGSTTVPLFGPRLVNAFFGQDGGTELLISGHGGFAQVTGSFFELSGNTTTGPNNSTPASNVGEGITITNGSNITLSGNIINQMSLDGVHNIGGIGVTLTGNRITNNGQAASSGNTFGFVNESGATADLMGNTIQNAVGFTSQTIGAVNAGTLSVCVGNNLKPNAITFSGTACTVGGATLNNQ